MKFIIPMQPTPAKAPFSDPNWLFEPKWDGYRALCFLEKGRLTFMSRNQVSLNKRFPELLEIRLKANQAVLDGEVVALDENGLPQFAGLRSKRLNCQIVYYAFDLLQLNDVDTSQLPLLKRKTTLKRILIQSARLRYTDHFIGNGEQLFSELEKLGLEGMVAKKKNGLYVSGKTRDWLKIKTAAGREEMKRRTETWGH